MTYDAGRPRDYWVPWRRFIIGLVTGGQRYLTMRSPWPRGLPIHSKNNPLAALPDSHPAKRLLFAHAECRRDCAGRDVPWRNREAIDQEWDSKIEGRRKTFSAFVYEHICFDLVLESWLERPPAVTDGEKWIQDRLPRLRALLNECEQAASADENRKIVEMVNQVRRYLDLWDEAINRRISEDCITTRRNTGH